MSLAPGTPKRPAAGTVVFNHAFSSVEATIIDLAPDVVAQGGNVFKDVTGSEDLITQTAGKGVRSAVVGTAQYSYNMGYPGDKDVEIKTTLPVDTDKMEVTYRGDGKDIGVDSFQILVRVEARADPAIRVRVRASNGAGLVSNRTLDTSGAAQTDLPVAAGAQNQEMSVRIEDREDKVSIYVNDTFVDSYTYTAAADGVAGVSGFPVANLAGYVDVGINPRDENVLMDDFKATIR
jgi:hypothetical protein